MKMTNLNRFITNEWALIVHKTCYKLDTILQYFFKYYRKKDAGKVRQLYQKYLISFFRKQKLKCFQVVNVGEYSIYILYIPKERLMKSILSTYFIIMQLRSLSKLAHFHRLSSYFQNTEKTNKFNEFCRVFPLLEALLYKLGKEVKGKRFQRIPTDRLIWHTDPPLTLHLNKWGI